MNIEPISFSIGLAIGVIFITLLQVKVIRRMALSLKKLGIEFGIDADDDQNSGGVKIGDIGGDVAGDIAGRDIHKNSNFFKSVQAAMNATRKTNETMLVTREHVKVDFPDTPEGQRAASMAREFAQQKDFFSTDASQRILLPHVRQFERSGWFVTAIRWSDNGDGGFYAEFTLEQPFKRNA